MRVSSGSRCYKSFHCSNFQSLQVGTRPKPPLNPSWVSCTGSSSESCRSLHVNFHLVDLMKLSIRPRYFFPEIGGLVKPKLNSPALSTGTSLRCWSLGKARNFSSSHPLKSEGVSPANALPWLAADGNPKKAKWTEKSAVKKGDRSSWKESDTRSERRRSSWDSSAKTFGKRGNRSSGDGPEKRYGKATIRSANRSTWEVSADNFAGQGSESADERIQGKRGNRSSGDGPEKRYGKATIRSANRSTWEVSADNFTGQGSESAGERIQGKRGNRSSGDGPEKRYGKATIRSANRSTWEVSADNFARQGSESADERLQGRRTRVDNVEQPTDDIEREESYEDVEDEEIEAIADPRWDKIKSRFRGLVDEKAASERPEFQRWNKQENWGRKTWKEASESTLPKMVGEGIYGVGPVLAALSAGRREFYALYMQEGLDLNNNNRKKKDKKGFEKVLRLAERNALTIKEISKHDLNMISDNRPHQGLVLDASPLEMVKIKELDLVSLEEDQGSLWLALDEVTDPQNLGAIIRSAYFFGASGVVLCAKNSAPLSGVVSKASAGSLELMELRYCKNMMQFLTSSAENGWRVLGASVSSRAIGLKEVPPGAPTILVLGSEGTGLRPLVERSCSQLVRIPGNIPVDIMIEKDNNDIETTQPSDRWSTDEFRSFMAVESLNVSVAAGVLVHHLIGSNQKNDTHLAGGGGIDDSLETNDSHLAAGGGGTDDSLEETETLCATS